MASNGFVAELHLLVGTDTIANAIYGSDDVRMLFKTLF